MNGHRHTTYEHEHEFEAARGLPEPLPDGETLLWQGAPDWRSLARHALHVRKLVLYFGVILALRFVSLWGAGADALDALLGTVWLLPPAALAVALAGGLAWLVSRTTVYTLTDRRVVMRVGIVLTLTFNLPLRRIEAAALHTRPDHHGDIALTLDRSTRIAYLHLWPHARPWRVTRTQPMLRALPDAAEVARMLTQAWGDARQSERPTVATATAPTPAAWAPDDRRAPAAVHGALTREAA